MLVKVCSKCGVEKGVNADNFYLPRTSWCKICHKKGATARGKAKEERRRRHINRYKVLKGCQHCGYNDNPVALDFHHSGDKVGGVAGMLTHTRKKLFTEIRKCTVLCANCHRVEHEREKREKREECS